MSRPHKNQHRLQPRETSAQRRPARPPANTSILICRSPRNRRTSLMSGLDTSDMGFDLSHAPLVLDTVAPGHRLISITPATAAFTNAVHVLDTVSSSGQRRRFVVKRMTDEPDPERAAADFHGLQIARRHGIPAPEPVLLDATGEMLGTPGIVTKFVRGRQIANPDNTDQWARDLADLLLRIHDVSPDANERQGIYDGNELGLYFLTGHWPEAS